MDNIEVLKKIEELEKIVNQQEVLIKKQEETINLLQELKKKNENDVEFTEKFFTRIMERGLSEAFLKINNIVNELKAEDFEKQCEELKKQKNR